MPRVIRPTLAPLGRPSFPSDLRNGLSFPVLSTQVPPLLALTQTPALTLVVTRPMLPRPTSRRLLLNGSMTRSVTEARRGGTVSSVGPLGGSNICVGTRMLAQ